MRLCFKLLFFIIIALFLSPLSRADTAAPVIELNSLSQQLIREPAEFLVTDPATTVDTLPLQQFRPLTDSHINQGISDQAFWIRFSLQNSSATAINWVLTHKTAYLDHINAYLRDDGGPVKTLQLSDRVPFAERPLAYRTLAFPHATAAGSRTEVLLKLYFDKADSVTLDFELMESDLFMQQQSLEYLIYGLFFGAMLLLVVISFLGAVLLRQWLYLLYTGFLVSSSLMWALLNGLAYQYLWPGSVFWHNEGFHILFLLVAATAILFSRRFLMTRLQFPRLDRILRWLPWLFAAGIVLRFAGVYEGILYLAMLSIVSLMLLSVLGLMAYRRGLIYARWYALAWAVYGCGLTLSVLAATTALLPWGMNYLLYAQFGAIVEAMLLLIALGDKIRHWEKEHQHVLQLVQQDPLTGVGNRRLMPEALRSLQNAFINNGKPVYMALLDLDDFKQINDRYGHEAGDAVLKSLSSLMQAVSRAEDVCIRQGGDEFMVLFQAGTANKALHKIDRLQRVFAEQRFSFSGDVFSISFSAGISLLFSHEQSLSEQSAFRQADQALYRAKQAGGNRCLLFQAEQDMLDSQDLIPPPQPQRSAQR